MKRPPQGGLFLPSAGRMGKKGANTFLVGKLERLNAGGGLTEADQLFRCKIKVPAAQCTVMGKSLRLCSGAKQGMKIGVRREEFR